MTATTRDPRRPSPVRRAVLVPVAAAVGAALAGCSAGDAPAPEPATSTASSPSTPGDATPTPSTTGPSPSSSPPDDPATGQPPTQAPADAPLRLNGPDLGVTEVGAPFDDAVEAVTGVLGEPEQDPARALACIGAEREVAWPEITLAGRDGVLAGWSTRDPALAAPSGVQVGTGAATLDEVYGDRLQRRPANPDNPPTFAVDGVDFSGTLSSEGADATVTGLFTRACSGP